MLRLNRGWTLRPFKEYKDHPEKYQEKYCGSRPNYGEFQQFQVHDKNYSLQGKPIFGFVYIQIYGCELDLKANDVVTIDKILFIQNKAKLTTIGCTIKEKSPFQADSVVLEDEDLGEIGF